MQLGEEKRKCPVGKLRACGSTPIKTLLGLCHRSPAKMECFIDLNDIAGTTNRRSAEAVLNYFLDVGGHGTMQDSKAVPFLGRGIRKPKQNRDNCIGVLMIATGSTNLLLMRNSCLSSTDARSRSILLQLKFTRGTHPRWL